MATKDLWYQRPRFLLLFSVIVAAGVIVTTYDRAELIEESDQTFSYSYQPKAAEGYIVLSDPVEVKVTFRGSERARLALLRRMPQEIAHPNHGLNVVGTYSVKIPKPDESSRLEMLSMEPDETIVLVDEMKLRTMTVRPDLKGVPASGFQVLGETVKPETVKIFMPSRIASVAEISTFPVNIQNFDAQRTIENVRLKLPEFGVLSESAKNGVVVDVPIVPIRETRLLDPVKIDVEGVPPGYTVVAQPNYVSIQVQVPKGENEISDLRAWVDVGDRILEEGGSIIEGTHENFKVELVEFPVWAENVQFRPVSISLQVTAIPKDPPAED